ncbi:type VI secretion system Vgr family protein [Paraburkholderia tropica]|uniref:type VI secretion system Vgr family protein n=1 Tax=Paraburkholderia tropica TaxID=92647 RepID=UPI001F3AB776|nr:type VI secretion system Vgr family protein [Paraburkholderia tropica]MDE1144247.1 type VI secretion system Vgr family protein [Paraburkholderia tropica]
MGVGNISSLISGAALLQDGRLLKLDTPLGDNVLLPQRAIGHTRIGRDYGFTIDAVATDENVDLSKLIAQPVTLWLQQADQTYLPYHGYVHTARRLGADGSLTSYQLEFASWQHFLKFRSDARIWQDKTADAILTDVFNAHPQAQGAFRFVIQNALPSRSFCVQYESDWNFCQRIMESEGLFSYFEQTTDGKSHTVVITDNIGALPALNPQSVNFYRSGVNSETNALVQWSGTRTLQSVTLATRTFDYKSPSTSVNPKGTSVPTLATQGNLPQQAEVYEYTGAYTYGEQSRGDTLSEIRMQEWESRAKRFEGAGAVRNLDAGRWFELDGHPVHDADSEQDRQFAVIDARWFIENNLPATTSQTQSFPHSLQGELAAIKSANQGDSDALMVKASDGSEGFLLVKIEAQRKAVPYRSPLDHHKPEMRMQTAIVVGPSNEEVYTDSLNRIKVHFHWDRLNAGDENASCWIRVAMSDSGSSYGGVHVPRVGEEVIVNWLDGDCDRPLVTARVYNGATTPNWHSNGILSGYKSKEYGGSGYNQLVMDDATGQNRAQLYSTSANSQLHLGYLVAQNANSRGAYLGSGFDLKSDAFGAINAGQGLYVSTYAKSTTSQQLDVAEAHSQLTNAQETIDALSQASESHQAETLQDGTNALKTFASATQSTKQGASASGGNTAGGGTGGANAFTDPVMLMASPSGIALSTQQSAHVTAAQQISVISGQSVQIASGKSLIGGAVEKISLFAQRSGIKLFAGKGKVEVQAQSDNVELVSQKATRLISATENVEIAAKKEIVLTSGGAYIRIKDGNIEIHAPGTIDVKGTQHSFAGPAQQNYPLPVFAQAETQGPVAFNMVLADMPGPNGHPYINMPWRIVSARSANDAHMSSDFILSGKSDSTGKVALSAADQKTLHDAWNATPGQIWLAYGGQVHSLALSRQTADWTESDRFYEALDAMGYSQRMYVTEQGDVDQGFAKLARQEWQTESDGTLLDKLKGEA